MPYVPCKKGTLLIPSGSKGGEEAKHLFVIVTDACAEHKHLLLGFTSLDKAKPHDPACIVPGGCHPFIDRDSYVLYRMAQIQLGDRLRSMVDGWVYMIREPASDELVEAMLEGVARSRFVPRFVQKYLQGI